MKLRGNLLSSEKKNKNDLKNPKNHIKLECLIYLNLTNIYKSEFKDNYLVRIFETISVDNFVLNIVFLRFMIST